MENENHQKVIVKFLNMCKLTQIKEMKHKLEERMQVMHKNPQQDDNYEGLDGQAAQSHQ
jgi:hypothetical protein